MLHFSEDPKFDRYSQQRKLDLALFVIPLTASHRKIIASKFASTNHLHSFDSRIQNEFPTRPTTKNNYINSFC